MGGESGGQGEVSLSVFAASSLAEAFQDLERGFEEDLPGIDVRLTLAGSQVLRLQIEQGAAVDVFASANEAHMEALAVGGLMSDVRSFAHNQLVLVVPSDNPAGIRGFSELDRAERIVLGTENVPVGRYAREVLRLAEAELGRGFVEAVEGRVVSEEVNARLVRAKVEMGEADAALIYRTDGTSSDRVTVIEVPEELNVRADYLLGRATRSTHAREADRFVAYASSEAGRRILARHGFGTEGS